jgi:hypothetical protein
MYVDPVAAGTNYQNFGPTPDGRSRVGSVGGSSYVVRPTTRKEYRQHLPISGVVIEAIVNKGKQPSSQ